MRAVPAVQWRKEVRELLPWWCAIVMTVVVCWALMQPHAVPEDWLDTWKRTVNRDFVMSLGLIVYAAGAVTLGALSIGNEYSNDTLTLLLVQPAERKQVLRVKLVVLTLMLTALGALVIAAWDAEPMWALIAGDLGRWVLIVLPLACGLLLAPWMTMFARGPLGGAVFATVLPSLLWMAATDARLPRSLFWVGAGALAVAGATMTWRTFMGLEVAGESRSNVDFTDWFSRSQGNLAPSRTQNRLWLLVKKELRLQQPTFMVAALYVAAWLIVVVGRRFSRGVLSYSQVYVITFLNMALVPLAAGALPSAEERRLGATDWHTLLPFAAWKQWAIKAGVAVGVAFALGVMLPRFLATMSTTPSGYRDGIEPLTAVMMCLGALYVSTLNTNGLRALLATGPVLALCFATAIFLDYYLVSPRYGVVLPLVRGLAKALPVVDVDGGAYLWWARHGPEWFAAGLGALLLWFGNANHKTSDRSRGRLARQFGWIFTYLIAALLGFSFGLELISVWLSQAPR